METQPLETPQDQQVSPSVPVSSPLNQITQPTSNSYLSTILSAMVLVAIGSLGAYFLITRAKPVLPVPTSSVQVITEDQPTQVEDDTQQIKNITIRDVKNSYLVMPYLTNVVYLMSNSNNGDLLLKDGVATFTYCEGNQSCDSSKIKNATVTLSVITAQKDKTLMIANEWGGNDGAMILAFDFGNSQKEYYLGMFAINNNETEKQNYLYFPPIKNLGSFTGKIENIDISTKGEVSLNLKTPTGLLRRTFLITEGRRFYDLTEITADKSQKIYDDQKLGYSFAYPQINGILQGWSGRVITLESTLKTSPIYYAQECGLQPTFADNIIPIWSTNASGDISLNANLTVHKIDTTPSVYLTSSLYGYDPADWGKIKQKVSIQNYVNSINTGASISGRKVVSENIQGYAVRHILPFSVGRPCDDQSREQYQWVKGNLLFNLIFTESKTQPSSVQQKTELINSIFSSLKVK